MSNLDLLYINALENALIANGIDPNVIKKYIYYGVKDNNQIDITEYIDGLEEDND